MTIELPFPPSVNHYWLVNRNGSRRISDAGLAFRDETILAVRQAGFKAIEGRVALRISAHPPDERRRDLDNILKPILDALQHAGCYADDSQVDDLHILRGEKIERGAVVVTIEVADDPGRQNAPRAANSA